MSCEVSCPTVPVIPTDCLYWRLEMLLETSGNWQGLITHLFHIHIVSQVTYREILLKLVGEILVVRSRPNTGTGFLFHCKCVGGGFQHRNVPTELPVALRWYKCGPGSRITWCIRRTSNVRLNIKIFHSKLAKCWAPLSMMVGQWGDYKMIPRQMFLYFLLFFPV